MKDAPQQLKMFPDNLLLKRVAAEENMHRFYLMTVQRDLDGVPWSLNMARLAKLAVSGSLITKMKRRLWPNLLTRQMPSASVSIRRSYGLLHKRPHHLGGDVVNTSVDAGAVLRSCLKVS